MEPRQPGLRIAWFLQKIVAFATSPRILCAGWLLFLVYSYPGYMSTDSVEQLLQARGVNPIHDGFPPLMARLWRITDDVVAGPLPMLAIQSLAFLIGLDRILRTQVRPRTAALVATALLLFPAIMTPMAVIWKDSQMAGFLLAGVAGLLSPRRRWRIAGCGLLFLATAQRYNAPAATLPLVLLLFSWRADLRGWRRYAIAAGIWVAITIAAFGLNRLLTERNFYGWHGAVAIHDIAGMIRYTPGLSDDELRAYLAGIPGTPTASIGEKFRKAYRATRWWYLSHGDDRVYDPPSTEEHRQAIARAWRELVLDHPGGYLKHRFMVFIRMLGISSQRSAAPVWDRFTENDAQGDRIAYRAHHGPVQAAWLAALVMVQDSLLFRPYAYFFIALLLLPLCRRQRIAFALLASGLLYELGSFIVVSSSDYRYSHWMIACSLIGAVLLFAARWRRGRAAVATHSEHDGADRGGDHQPV